MIFDFLGRERYRQQVLINSQSKLMEDLVAEKKALQASLDEYAAANKQIADEFTEQKRTNDRQARSIEEKLSQVADLKRENQTLAQQKSSLRHQADNLESLVEGLQENCENNCREIESLQGVLDERNDEIAMLDDQVERLRNNLAALTTQVEGLRDDLNKCELELLAKEQANEKFRDKLEEAYDEGRRYCAHAVELQDEIDCLSAEKDGLVSQRDAVIAELDRRTAQLDKIEGFLGPWAKRLLPSLEVVKQIEEGWTAVDGEYPWDRDH